MGEKSVHAGGETESLGADTMESLRRSRKCKGKEETRVLLTS